MLHVLAARVYFTNLIVLNNAHIDYIYICTFLVHTNYCAVLAAAFSPFPRPLPPSMSPLAKRFKQDNGVTLQKYQTCSRVL